MLIQQLKTCRRLYLLAVILLVVSLLVIFFHRHDNNQSRKNCQICKIAKDISCSNTPELFFLVYLELFAAPDTVDIFSPVVISTLLVQNSRASPLSRPT